MNRSDFIKIVEEAGFCVNEDGTSISTANSYGIIKDELERFAVLLIGKQRFEPCPYIECDCDGNHPTGLEFTIEEDL